MTLETLYDGPWPSKTFMDIQNFASCFCGDKIYIIGSQPLDIYDPEQPGIQTRTELIGI